MNYYIDTEFHEYKKQSKLLGLNVGQPIDTIELISIGIVAEDNSRYYAVCKEFDIRAAWNNKWLRTNVLAGIYNELYNKLGGYAKSYMYHLYDWTLKGFTRLINEFGKTKEQIKNEVLRFTTPKDDKQSNPVFYAYYADYDWVVFCWLFGRMIDLPKGYPYYCRDLIQILHEEETRLTEGDGKIRYHVPGSEVIGLFNSIKEFPDYPTQQNEHDALDDAKWNKKLHEFIIKVKKELV